MFRYLTPREGTETTILFLFADFRTVQIPYSPRGDGNGSLLSCFGALSSSSDTLLPERGRKPVRSKDSSKSVSFRYLTPREGTETSASIDIRYKGTKGSDTLLPERGRKRFAFELFRCIE